MNKFGVLAWPAYLNKESNPYNFLIYSEIEAEGYPVFEFEFNIKNVIKFCFSSQFKVFHIHWPSSILTWSTELQAKRRLITFNIFLKILKLFNKKIVWTVHNLQAHESNMPKLQEELYRLLYKNTDGFISLNKDGLKGIKSLASRKNVQKFAYISHPHYKGYYQDTISERDARLKLGIGQEKKVFLFLGQIRRYKNVSGLISAFNDLELEDKYLIIAGKVHDEMLDEIKEKSTGHEDIIVYDSFIDDDELQLYFNSADLIVNPYTNIFNSGSVFLNMSFNKPTLAPALGAFPELQLEIGKQFIKLYQKDNIEAIDLHDAMLEALVEKEQIKAINLTSFNAKKVAEETIEFYKSLC